MNYNKHRSILRLLSTILVVLTICVPATMTAAEDEPVESSSIDNAISEFCDQLSEDDKTQILKSQVVIEVAALNRDLAGAVGQQDLPAALKALKDDLQNGTFVNNKDVNNKDIKEDLKGTLGDLQPLWKDEALTTYFGEMTKVLKIKRNIESMQKSEKTSVLQGEALGSYPMEKLLVPEAGVTLNQLIELAKSCQVKMENLYRENQLALDSDQNKKIQDLENGLVERTRKENDMQNSIDTANTELKELKSKVLFAYIALAIGGLSLAVGALATVLALRQRKDATDFDSSDFASQEAVRQLKDSQKELKGQLLQEEERQNAMEIRLQNKIKQQDDRLESMVQRMQSAPAEAQAAPRAAQQRIPPVLTPQPAGFLRLHYQDFAANNAYLSLSADPTDYQLYNDGTVEYRDLTTLKSLDGWKQGGLCYLYDLEANGQRLTPGISSYYQVRATKRRARVNTTNNGSYRVEEKGILEMALIY